MNNENVSNTSEHFSRKKVLIQDNAGILANHAAIFSFQQRQGIKILYSLVYFSIFLKIKSSKIVPNIKDKRQRKYTRNKIVQKI